MYVYIFVCVCVLHWHSWALRNIASDPRALWKVRTALLFPTTAFYWQRYNCRNLNLVGTSPFSTFLEKKCEWFKDRVSSHIQPPTLVNLFALWHLHCGLFLYVNCISPVLNCLQRALLYMTPFNNCILSLCRYDTHKYGIMRFFNVNLPKAVF